MTEVKLDVLNPLRDALHAGQFTRLLARPGWVMGEGPDGVVPMAVAWSQAQHAQVQDVLHATLFIDAQTEVSRVGPTLVLARPVDGSLRMADLSRDGWISDLAGRTLSATMGVGRNVLVTGPWALCAHIVTALLNEGQRPALLGEAGAPLPAHWAQLPDPQSALSYGADRVGAWFLPASELVCAMEQLSGVVGYLEARRLDRVLMRFEAGAEALPGRTSAPLHVLAGLDVVVVCSQHGGPRVREVAEIVLADTGYRPQMLFASGLPPAPAALVPQSMPTFVAELAHADHGALADELRVIGMSDESATWNADGAMGIDAPGADTPGEVPQYGAINPGAAAQSGVSAARGQASARRGPTMMPNAGHAGATGAGPGGTFRQPAFSAPPQYDAPPRAATKSAVPRPVEESSELSHPGWELDRVLGDAALGEDGAPGVPHMDDAAMAATFGLGPPPRPAGATRGFGDYMQSHAANQEDLSVDSDLSFDEDGAESDHEK